MDRQYDIKRLYQDQHLTVDEIATLFGVSARTIYRMLDKEKKLFTRNKQRFDMSRLEEVKELYYTSGLSCNDIAEQLGVSYRTVSRLFRKLGLPARLRRPWSPPDPCTLEFAYLLGAIITDGTWTERQVAIHNTELSFLEACRKGASQATHGKVTLSTSGSPTPGSWGTKSLHKLTIYGTSFSEWLTSEMGHGKQHIPPYIMNAAAPCILRFLSAAIDGDGTIYPTCIRIRKTHNWILELPALCHSVGLHSSEQPRVAAKLPSGKIYWAVNVRRRDFILAGGCLEIPYKQAAMLSHD